MPKIRGCLHRQLSVSTILPLFSIFSVENSHLLEVDEGLHKPLYSGGGIEGGDGNGLTDEVPAIPDAMPSGNRLRVNIALIVSAYLLLGMVFYTTLAGMTPLDALYFCVGELRECVHDL